MSVTVCVTVCVIHLLSVTAVPMCTVQCIVHIQVQGAVTFKTMMREIAMRLIYNYTRYTFSNNNRIN